MSLKITRRAVDTQRFLFSSDISSLLQRIYAARGVFDDSDLEYSLTSLYDYAKIKDIDKAAAILSEAIIAGDHIMIVGDYDADGATSCALAIEALRQFGAINPSFLVPDRFEYGYGLSPEIVKVAAEKKPDVLVTVDNGISSVEGVKAAKNYGMKVIVTDHHLPGTTLPKADAIVNPNQPDCPFAGKNTAGVGVIFYTMCAVRTCLDKKKWFGKGRTKPNMASLLDLVALGTIADVVSLDKNNRILVHQGLRRIQAGHVRPGIQALVEVANRSLHNLTTTDMGFSLAPRLNAAGRLDDMSMGIALLLSQSPEHARQIAKRLDELNRERREIEEGMRKEAFERLETLPSDTNEKALSSALCFYQPDWHPGVIGIVAARVKEKTNRPVIAFAAGDEGFIKGSARSVNGFHIRDALALVDSRFPSLLCSYGGHAMAAGLTIKTENLEQFSQAFEQVASELLTEAQLSPAVLTDGALEKDELTLSTAEMLNAAGPWGQHFPEPVFDGLFKIAGQKLIKNRHLKMMLMHPEGSQWIDAVMFNSDTTLWPNLQASSVRVVYQLCVNEFKSFRKAQILIRHLEPA